MKYFTYISFIATLWVSSAQAETQGIASIYQNWPTFALQNKAEEPTKDMIDFEEADLDQIQKKVEEEQYPIMPLNKTRQFTRLVSMNNPDIKWRFFSSAFASNKYSGFSQGIGGTTILLDDELFLDFSVEKVQFNSKDKDYYQDYEGDKYRVNTMMHWYPTENFSLHLGFNGWVDK
ncbi:MAG: hypothetical protein NE330_16625 [Lentisphaeraceae bacterium]|nr:hypothetical protein [Lentisphaeraceae bacterium]